MGQSRTFKSAFNTGELSNDMKARTDVASYLNGAAKLTNVLCKVQGGVETRPGTIKKETLTNGIPYQLERYIFDDDEQYVLIFSNAKVEFVDTASGTIVDTLTSQPWATAQIGELTIASEGDTIIVMHEAVATRQITRTSISTFTSAAYAYETDDTTPNPNKWCPYANLAPAGTTLTPSATTGSINLTLSTGHWVASHVGEHVRYQGVQIKITSRTSSTIAVGTVIGTLPGTTASTDWDEEAFNSRNGYPRCGIFHDQRLWFFGSTDLPRHAFSTKIGAFFNFDTGTGLDNESISGTIASSDVGAIRKAEGNRQLQLFCDKGEVFIPATEAKPLTPSNLAFKVQSKFGIGSPRHVDEGVQSSFYVTPANALRKFEYDELQAAFESSPLSYLAQHLLTTVRVVQNQLEGFGSTESLAFIVNEDGKLAVNLYENAENINAFMDWQTNGDFEDVCTVGDNVYVICDRVVNGANVTWFEEFSKTVILDGCTQLTNGSPQSVWSGLTDYSNQEVDVVSGNIYIGKYTVDGSGNLDISPVSVTDIDVGFQFSQKIKTLPPELQLNDGPITGQMRRVVKCEVMFDDTYYAKVQGNALILRQQTDDLNEAVTPFTGFSEFYMRGWDRHGQVSIESEQPLQMRVLGINITVEY